MKDLDMQRRITGRLFPVLSSVLAMTAWPSSAQEMLSDRLEAALLSGQSEELVELVSDTADRDTLAIGRTPLLHHAIATGDTALVAALLEAGLPVDLLGPGGDTALTLAVSLGQKEIAERLVDRGANRSLRNANGMAAWEIAAREGDASHATHLLPMKGRKAAASAWLLNAARSGDKDGMRAALFAGADLHTTTDSGETILQFALAEQSWPVRAFLLGLPEWTRASALREDDVQNLLIFALSQPNGSGERRFAVETLEALTSTGVIEASAVKSAIRLGLNTRSPSAERTLLEYIGFDAEILNDLFPEPNDRLPPIEFSLPMDAPRGGVQPVHWRQIQLTLKEEGLYSGPIDGKPGQQTYDAIFAYVMGVAPLLIERAGYAHEHSDLDDGRYGISRTTSLTNNKTYYISGERIRVAHGSEAVGYTVVSEDPNFSSLHSFRYDATPVPKQLPRGWRGKYIMVSDCRKGVVHGISATLLGARFSILLNGQPRYVHDLPGDDRFRAELVGDFPAVECE